MLRSFTTLRKNASMTAVVKEAVAVAQRANRLYAENIRASNAAEDGSILGFERRDEIRRVGYGLSSQWLELSALAAHLVRLTGYELTAREAEDLVDVRYIIKAKAL